MRRENTSSMQELLALFEETVSPADVLSAKLIAQISSSITRERLKLGMNQTQFAKHIGVQQSQVSRWEHGDYNFSLQKVAEIAAALKLDVNIFMHDFASGTAMNEASYNSKASFVRTVVYHNTDLRTQPQQICFGESQKRIIHTISKEDSKYASIC